MNAHTVKVGKAVRMGLTSPHAFMCAIEPTYRMYRHTQYIGRLIAEAALTPNSRVIVNVAPRVGKSELIARAFPAWYLTLFPQRRVILGCHGDELATTYGGQVRDIFQAHPELGIELKADVRAKAAWNTQYRPGGMKAVGAGTGVMGFGADLCIIDDPYGSWEDSQSAAVRRRVFDWYRGTIVSRLEPGASLIILHHRMHPKDLTGQILASEEGHRFRHISLPSLALENDPMGRAPGEALVPERYTAEALQAARVTQGAMFEALHQQQPTALAAGAAYNRFSPDTYPNGNVDPGCELVAGLPVQVAFDFNIDPGMYCSMGQHIKGADEFTVVDEIYADGLPVDQCAHRLGKWLRDRGFRDAELYGDSSGHSRNQGDGTTNYQIIRQVLQSYAVGLSFRAPKDAPGIVASLNHANYALRDVPGAFKVRINPRCGILLRDLAEVELATATDGKVAIDKSNRNLTHASDAFRYRIAAIKGGIAGIVPRGEMRVDW